MAPGALNTGLRSAALPCLHAGISAAADHASRAVPRCKGKPGMAQLSKGQAFEMFCGIDVAWETHHAITPNPVGRRLVDRPLPKKTRPRCAPCSKELTGHGSVL